MNVDALVECTISTSGSFKNLYVRSKYVGIAVKKINYLFKNSHLEATALKKLFLRDTFVAL